MGALPLRKKPLPWVAGTFFEITDAVSRHKNIEFPGHKHANLYDVSLIEPAVRKALLKTGVTIHLQARVRDIELQGGTITKVIADIFNGDTITASGDAFVDVTGTAGPQGNCMKHGNGCAMCILRCPTFGPRFSIASKAGVKEIVGEKPDGTFGAMSGSCKLQKDSLSAAIQKKLNKTGVCIVAVPKQLQKSMESLGKKACLQYATKEFAENIVLLDTGHAKLMTAYYPLDILRQVPGFENARFEDPYAGGIGNSMRYFGMLPRDNALKVDGLNNVYCGGEKAGLLVGHTEAIVTGTLAGHNAARCALGLASYVIPETLACGDAIAYVKQQMQAPGGLTKKYTFSGSVYFESMKNKNLYTTDIAAIQTRVATAKAKGVFAKTLA